MLKGMIWGMILTLFLGLIGGYFFISGGYFPANADGKPPAIEKWMARTSLNATLRKEAPQTPNPTALNDLNLIAGIKIYGENCAVCHGASDGMASHIAKGLYQHAPQLARHGVEDDPEGETYWLVKHGIRLTGMPAFSPTLTEEEIWKVVLFLKHMDSLTPAAKKAWEAVPSSTTGL